jgi:hypothetical protein
MLISTSSVQPTASTFVFKKIRILIIKNVTVLGIFFSGLPLYINKLDYYKHTVVYPGIFFGGGSTNSVEDRGQRERGSGGGSSLVRGSGGSYNLVQEISFHRVKFC